MADVNERLREAAKAGDAVGLKALLREPGCDAFDKGKSGMTALMWSALKGHEVCVGILLPASDALGRDENGMTVLMLAAALGYEACVRRLLPVSDTLTTDKDGLTALMGAAANGHEDCIRLLLPMSDALAKDEAGRTASGWARGKGHENLALFIEAYALAQTEKVDIEVAVFSNTPRVRASLRV